MSQEEFENRLAKLTKSLEFMQLLGKLVGGIGIVVLGCAAWIWNVNTQIAAQTDEIRGANLRFQVSLEERKQLVKENQDAHKRYEELLARLTVVIEMQQRQMDRIEGKIK